MDKPNNRWFRFRLFVVSLLIISLLGPSDTSGLFHSGFCFVNGSGASKSILTLFEEGKTGEELTEKDAKDEFEDKSFHADIYFSAHSYGFLRNPDCLIGIASSDRFRPASKSLPIYLAHHALLI